MEDRSAMITSLVEDLLPWVHTRQGTVRHALVSRGLGRARTLCGLAFPEWSVFIWKGRHTDKPAGQLAVCENCANIGRAIVLEAGDDRAV